MSLLSNKPAGARPWRDELVPTAARSSTGPGPLDLAALEADLLAEDDTETTLVIGHWHYVGSGWNTDAERVLAIAAAARAREYDQWRAAQRRIGQESGDRTT